MSTATEFCPAVSRVGSDDMSDTVCELPITHNVGGSWHEATDSGDDYEVTVRWAPEIGGFCPWPKLVGAGLTSDQTRYLLSALDRAINAELGLVDVPLRLPKTLQWRTFAPLPTVSPPMDSTRE